MRVAVTGASGLIGSALVSALRERGDLVVTFVRPSSKADVGHHVRWEPQRDFVDGNDLQRIDGFDAVVNLAGAGIGDRRWNAARRREILDSRLSSTKLLVSSLEGLSRGVAHVVSASAIGWYGSRGDEVLDETSRRGTGFLSEVCARWEEATTSLEGRGLGVTHVRSGVVLSPQGGALGAQLPLFRRGLGGRYASGAQWTSVISLLDEVRALLWILDHRLTGAVNLVSPQPLTNKEFTRALSSALHRRAPFGVPALALKAVLGSEMASDLILASQRVTPGRLLSSHFTFEHVDAAAALKWSLINEGR